MSRDGALTFRPAWPHEAPALAEMSRDLIEVGLPWRYTPRRISALLADPECVAVVAGDGPRIEGFALMHFGDDEAHLVLLCVRPARQRRGVGRRLAGWLLESARVAGIAAIGLELRADNAAAWAFYRRLGYTETRLVPAYYEGRFAARRMVLQLRLNAPAS